MKPLLTPRDYLLLATFGLAFCLFLLATDSDHPAYTDAYYYYNAGEKLATGNGLTDSYLWVYVNAPDALPTQSHRYWMPLASIVAALPMLLFGAGFNSAQWAFVPFLIGLSLCGLYLGARIGGKRRIAWITGLSVLFGGFYLPFWLTTDTFALYGFIGGGALLALGKGQESGNWRWYGLAGLLGGLGHLARADGILLVIVGVWIVLLQQRKREVKTPLVRPVAVVLLAYLVVMLPWFARNMAAFGAPLPTGGIGTAFLQNYEDLFSYPAEWLPANLTLSDWLTSRWEGLLTAFQTWLAVEGLVILAPLALWEGWRRRSDPFLRGFLWYAVGLHLAMSLIFTYPGIRGGLFHSSAALFPFWIALGLTGVDRAVAKLAQWRRWRTRQAQAVFGWTALLLPLTLGLSAWSGQAANQDSRPDYGQYARVLPPDARVMVNDPAAWYYHTGLMGVTLPDEPLETALTIAERYCITHLVIDFNVTAAFDPLLRGETPPPFLTEIRHFEHTNPDWEDDVRIYAFDVACTP